MDDRPEPEELSRSDMRALRGALRNDWPIPEDVKQRLLRSLIHLCDPETVEGAMAGPRSRIAAARTIAAFMKLTLGQAAVDLAREKFEGKKDGQVPLADVVAAAEKRAEERIRERDRAEDVPRN